MGGGDAPSANFPMGAGAFPNANFSSDYTSSDTGYSSAADSGRGGANPHAQRHACGATDKGGSSKEGSSHTPNQDKPRRDTGKSKDNRAKNRAAEKNLVRVFQTANAVRDRSGNVWPWCTFASLAYLVTYKWTIAIAIVWFVTDCDLWLEAMSTCGARPAGSSPWHMHEYMCQENEIRSNVLLQCVCRIPAQVQLERIQFSERFFANVSRILGVTCNPSAE